MTDNQIIVYGTTWCPDVRRARKYFDRNEIPYDFIDVDKDQEGLAFVKKTNNGKRVVPTIVFPDGSILVEPSNSQLASKFD